jgi:hypothetical protein
MLSPGRAGRRDPKEDDMNDTLSLEDRRHVRTSLIASLAVVFTLLLSTFAWAGVNAPSGEPPAPSISAARAADGSGSAADTNEMVGCGCAEGCAG